MSEVKLKRLRVSAQLPSRATGGSAYQDLYAAEEVTLKHMSILAVTTGWQVEVPYGYFLDVRTRSGMSLLGLIVSNAPGVVDADFRGELKVILANLSGSDYTVHLGDRVAQCALMPVIYTTFTEVAELSVTTRGVRGYGSSGR